MEVKIEEKIMKKSIMPAILISFVSCFLLAADDSLPKVLIIGDSISLGYTPFVMQALEAKAFVEHNKDPDNAGDTGRGIENIDKWLGDTEWDVIHFNWGLWDICHRVEGKRNLEGPIAATPEEYEEQLTKLVKRLKETGAALIWAPITYVQGGWGRVKGDEIKYNAIAEKIMKEHGVKINDIHALTATFPPELFKSKGNVHFSTEGYKKIAEQVTARIEEALGKDTNMPAPIKLSALDSPIIILGDSMNAFRDPTAICHEGIFYVYSTLVRTEEDKNIYSYTMVSTSRDLQNWSTPKIITPKGQHLNYSSPGNIIRFEDEWIICLQTYPRPNYKRGGGIKWATSDARIFIMRSKDLLNWSEPKLLRVRGPDVSVEEMGRMIDPYLLEDKDESGKWWCFFKQRDPVTGRNDTGLSWSLDLKNWTYFGHTDSGENVCVLVEGDEYVLIHSLRNGMRVKRSFDLKNWRDENYVIMLGHGTEHWKWTEARMTAGFVLDLRKEPRVGKYLMFFHGGGPGRKRTQDNVDANCSLGIAWSDDLVNWEWPAKATVQQNTSADAR